MSKIIVSERFGDNEIVINKDDLKVGYDFCGARLIAVNESINLENLKCSDELMYYLEEKNIDFLLIYNDESTGINNECYYFMEDKIANIEDNYKYIITIIDNDLQIQNNKNIINSFNKVYFFSYYNHQNDIEFVEVEKDYEEIELLENKIFCEGFVYYHIYIKKDDTLIVVETDTLKSNLSFVKQDITKVDFKKSNFYLGNNGLEDLIINKEEVKEEIWTIRDWIVFYEDEDCKRAKDLYNNKNYTFQEFEELLDNNNINYATLHHGESNYNCFEVENNFITDCIFIQNYDDDLLTKYNYDQLTKCIVTISSIQNNYTSEMLIDLEGQGHSKMDEYLESCEKVVEIIENKLYVTESNDVISYM